MPQPEDEEGVVPLLPVEQEFIALRPRSAAASGRARIVPVPQLVRVHRRQLVSVCVFHVLIYSKINCRVSFYEKW